MKLVPSVACGSSKLANIGGKKMGGIAGANLSQARSHLNNNESGTVFVGFCEIDSGLVIRNVEAFNARGTLCN